MDYILSNKYITNKKDANKEIKKDLNINGNLNEKLEDEDDEDEIDTKIFNGLLLEDKKLSTNNSNKNNEKNLTKEKKNSRNFDTYINENNNLIDLNFISFGEVNSIYNFKNGKSDTNSNININTNKKLDSKIKNKLSPLKNKLNLIKSSKEIKNGLEEKDSPPSPKNKRKNSNGSLNVNENNININNINSINKQKDNTLFLNKQIFKINNLFGHKNENDNDANKEIIRNYWESKNYFKISEINKGDAILVSEDDNIINFPAFLLPKGAKLGETYTFEIKSMDKGFIYKNQKANEIDDIQKKFLNPEDNN